MARSRINAAKFHPFVEDLRVNFMHASLLLEALNGDFNALNERYARVVHTLLFFEFSRRNGAVNIILFETMGFNLSVRVSTQG